MFWYNSIAHLFHAKTSRLLEQKESFHYCNRWILLDCVTGSYSFKAKTKAFHCLQYKHVAAGTKIEIFQHY